MGLCQNVLDWDILTPISPPLSIPLLFGMYFIYTGCPNIYVFVHNFFVLTIFIILLFLYY